MDTTPPVQQEGNAPTAPENVITQGSTKKRKVWIVGGAIVVLLLLFGVSGYFMTQQKTKMTQEVPVISQIPKPSVTPTPASPSADFVPYGSLSGEEKFAVAYNFSDPILKTSFAYPPGYSVQSLKADEANKQAGVFFLKNPNQTEAVGIQTYITCIVEQRKTAKLGCLEGDWVRGDVQVTLSSYTTKQLKKFDEDKIRTDYRDRECKKEITTADRILYACYGKFSTQADDYGMEYVLYLLGDNQIKVSVFSKTPKEQAHLIRSIISSATNHL